MNFKNHPLVTKFESLVLRERLLLVGAVFAFLYMTSDLVFIQPIIKEVKALTISESDSMKENNSLSAELTVFESVLKKDPNASLKDEYSKLTKKLNELDNGLQTLSVGLVTAEDLPIMLHDVLQQSSKLKLINIETKPAEEVQLEMKHENSLIESANELDNKVLAQSLKDTDAARLEAQIRSRKKDPIDQVYAQNVKLFKHGVTLTLSGAYKDVSGYVSELEIGRWRFYWESISYKVKSYPNAEVKLEVYTLSSERGVFDGR